MAEQDRYGSHRNSNPSNPVKDASGSSINVGDLFRGSGAEQDRYDSHFGPGVDKVREVASGFDASKLGSGAEQDRYGSYWGLGSDGRARIRDTATRLNANSGSGAEQDRYASHFRGPENVREAASRFNLSSGSGAEQDRHASHFSLPSDARERIADTASRWNANSGSGAEQDRYGSHWSLGFSSRDKVEDATSRFGSNVGSGAEQDRYGAHLGPSEDNMRKAISGFSLARLGKAPMDGAEQDRYGSHFSLDPNNPIVPGSVGILRSTLLPSIGFHSGLAVVAYAASRATNRVEGKDWLWPSGQVLNAWWCAVGYKMVNDNISLSTAVSHLTYTEKLLLTGVTAWGVRLFYRIASRSIARGTDDPRYEEAKKEEGFWNKALFSLFLPEALFQAVISMPFVLAFRPTTVFGPFLDVHPELTHALGVALFSAGFTMEVLADTQLAAHQKSNSDDLNREGVWSIVRHPNYLGDALIHTSFPLLLWSAGIIHPLALLGPVANYVFLRFVGGDAENETAQEQRYVKESHRKHGQFEEYKREKNSFWPKPDEATNPWTWAVLGAGIAGVALERGFRSYLHR